MLLKQKYKTHKAVFIAFAEALKSLEHKALHAQEERF